MTKKILLIQHQEDKVIEGLSAALLLMWLFSLLLIIAYWQLSNYWLFLSLPIVIAYLLLINNCLLDFRNAVLELTEAEVTITLQKDASQTWSLAYPELASIELQLARNNGDYSIFLLIIKSKFGKELKLGIYPRGKEQSWQAVKEILVAIGERGSCLFIDKGNLLS